MIETEYRRNDGRSYMVCKDENICNSYDIKMVQQNRIKGFIPLEVIICDEKEQYWYDISGYQALDTWAEDRKVGAKELQMILISYRDALRQCRRYLLNEERINLKKENIFISSKDSRVCFCYMPFTENCPSDNVIELFEYYMTIMDHSDGRGVKNCYDAYEECRRPNALIEDVIICFENSDIGDIEDINEYSKDNLIKENIDARFTDENVRVYADETLKHSANMKKISLRDIEWGGISKFSKKKEKKQQRIMYIAEPEIRKKEKENQTVLLGADSDRILGRLIYQGEGEEQSFVISNKDFTIGSSPELDAVISSSTVSRKHARISEKNDNYYIEDLNSKNGTKVNGQWLNYKDYRILRKNDRIKFADCEYLFI